VLLIASGVPRNFRHPVVAITHWNSSASRAIMFVPETTMNKNHLSATGKGNIGITGDVLAMNTKSIAKAMQE
jgi:hypothetical protein